MTEKNYKKRLEFQQNMISRQSEQIEELKSQIEKLKLECRKKDETINSVAHLRDEMSKQVAEVKEYKQQYKGLIEELKTMKNAMNKSVYKGRWNLVKLLTK